MKELLALGLAIASIVSYFALSTGFGVYQRIPWLHMLGGLLACVWLARLISQRTGLRRGLTALALLVAVGLTGLYSWYALSYSSYSSQTSAVAEGESLAAQLRGIQLASHAGQTTPVLRPGEDAATLLVFYRGHW